MTSKSGGPTVNPSAEPDRELEGNAAKKGDKRADRGRGGTESADDCAPIDLDTAHDRAS